MFWRKKRKPPPPVPPEPLEEPELPEEPEDVQYWVVRLARRLARLRRFRELRAPENIVEEEKRLVREAIATLSPGEALSVIQLWPQLVHHLDQDCRREESDVGGSKKRRAAPN